MCGSTYGLQIHHIFNGANKKHSEEYPDTCLMTLCAVCHRKIHDTSLIELKRQAQINTMNKYKLTEEEFIRIFHKSYLC